MFVTELITAGKAIINGLVLQQANVVFLFNFNKL